MKSKIIFGLVSIFILLFISVSVNATINKTGFFGNFVQDEWVNKSSFYQDEEDSWGIGLYDSFNVSYPASNTFDEDFSTYSIANNSGYIQYLYENYTIPLTVDDIIFTHKVNNYRSQEIIYCKNEDDSSWSMFYELDDLNFNETYTANTTLPNYCKDGNILMIRMRVDNELPYAWKYYYETAVTWINSTSINELIFTGADSQTLYTKLPKYSNVTYSRVDVSGFSFDCYQETANISTSCGGLNSGTYSCEGIWSSDCYYTYDGNYSTFDYRHYSNNATLYINYTKPSVAGSNSLWQIADDLNNKKNLSIPSSCWNYNPNKLLFRAISVQSPQQSLWQCYNGSWITLSTEEIFIHDEGMYWKLYITNISVDINSNNIFNQSGIFNTTNTTTDFNAELNAYLSLCTADTYGYCDVPFTFHSDTAGILQADIGNSINYSIMYNLTHEDVTIEKDLETYTLEVFTNATTYAILYYNNISYTTLRTTSDDKTTFTVSTRGDWLDNSTSILNSSIPLYWEMNVSNVLYNTSEYNQTKHKIYIYNGTTCTPVTLNFTGYDEISGDELNISFDGTFTVWHESSTYSRNYPFSINGDSNYKFCIYPDWATYYTDSIISYDATNYNARFYYLNNLDINNVTQNVYLYLINSTLTNDLTIYVYDEGGSALDGYFVQVEKYDIGTDTYQLTSITETDVNGAIITDIIFDTVKYKFSVKNPSGVVVYTTSPMTVSTTPLTFYVTDEEAVDIDFFDVLNISNYIIYDEDDQEFRFYYSDSDNIVSRGCLIVEKLQANGQTEICNTCISAVTGTLTCEVLNSSTGMYQAKGYVDYNNETYMIAEMSKDFGGFYKETGREGNILAIFLIGVITFIGLFNPVVAIVLCVIGIIFAFLLGLWHLTLGMLITIIIVGGMIILKKR